MKIIHTSDWHIGQQFYNYDRSDEHRSFFCQLAEVVREQAPDALIVSGDVFDTAAQSAASRRLYAESMISLHEACPSMQIVVTAGNHDSSSNLEAEGSLWRLAAVKVVGRFSEPESHIVEIKRDGVLKGYVVALPHSYPQNIPDFGGERADRLGAFAKEALSKIPADGLPVVLMAHTTVSSFDYSEKLEAVGNIDSVSLESFGDGYDYLALGHIHMPQTSLAGSRMARYCGSPVPISFSEEFSHSVSLVELCTRGETPVLKEITLDTGVAVKTVPFHPVGLEETLEYLGKHPFTSPTYVRVQIASESYLPVDSAERVSRAVAEAGGMYCQIKLIRPVVKTNDTATTAMDVSELKDADPYDIALKYYEAKNGHPLDEELARMLKEICEEP